MHFVPKSPTDAHVLANARTVREQIMRRVSKSAPLKPLDDSPTPVARTYCFEKLATLPTQARKAENDWKRCRQDVELTFSRLDQVQLSAYAYPRVKALHDETMAILKMDDSASPAPSFNAHDCMRLIRSFTRKTQWLQHILAELKSIYEIEPHLYPQ